MNTEENWEQRWQDGRTGWDRGASSPALTDWLDSNAVLGRVLVPGAGSGYEVVALARLGFMVTAIDLAPSAIARLRQHLDQASTNAELVLADMLEWQPDQPFDTIYEQTSLCALAPRHWPAYQSQLASWLRPGGNLLAQFMQTARTGGPPWDCPMPVMRELFSEERWIWPDHNGRRIDHPAGIHECSIRLQRR